MLSGQWQASDVNLKRSMVSILTKSTLWPGNLEAISWCVCVCVCVCLCVCVCVCVCVRARMRVCVGSYINTYFPQSFVSTRRREEGVFLLAEMERGGEMERSQRIQRKRKRAGEENHVFIPKTIYLVSQFWYSGYYWGREENMLKECSFYFFPSAKPPADRLCPESCFSSKGLWEFWWMSKGVSAYIVRWTEGPPPCRSPHSPLHLLRLSDSKGGPHPHQTVMLFPKEAVLPQGDWGSIATISQRFVEHHCCFVFSHRGPALWGFQRL